MPPRPPHADRAVDRVGDRADRPGVVARGERRTAPRGRHRRRRSDRRSCQARCSASGRSVAPPGCSGQHRDTASDTLRERERRARSKKAAQIVEGDPRIEVVATDAHEVRARDEGIGSRRPPPNLLTGDHPTQRPCQPVATNASAGTHPPSRRRAPRQPGRRTSHGRHANRRAATAGPGDPTARVPSGPGRSASRCSRRPARARGARAGRRRRPRGGGRVRRPSKPLRRPR